MSIIMPDNKVSLVESRTLMQLPDDDWSDLNTLTGEWEDYVVDQFPFREKMLKAYTTLELAQGKKCVRDVYIVDDGWLMTYIYRTQENKRQIMAQKLRAYTESTSAKFVYAIIPQKNEMLSELAEPYLENVNGNFNKSELLKELSKAERLMTIDISDYLTTQYSTEERRQMCYRTDFHWNSYGAFTAAEYIAKEMSAAGLTGGASIPTESDFDWEELGDTHLYEGDLNRRLSDMISMQEKIPYYCIKDTENIRYFMSVDNSLPTERTNIVSSGIADYILNYDSISTENIGYYRIVNPNARSQRHILILKDSYQNPTIDYFTELFSEVTVIDPREYSEYYSLADLLDISSIDIVLLMYHQNNISNELIDFLE
jgi:hypothetical protein